jgi:hypothetical protein
MIFHQAISITGVANQTVYDTGIEGTVEEPKKLISVLVQVTGYSGNFVEGWSEKVRITEVPDYLIDTPEQEGDANSPKSAQRINEIPVDMELPAGKKYQLAMRCGATNKDVVGAYVFEVTK